MRNACGLLAQRLVEHPSVIRLRGEAASKSPKIVLIPAGVQAASSTGILADRPSATTISDRKYNRKPAATPLTSSMTAPPRRCMRRLNVAATSTIAQNRNGRASRTLKCSRWRCAEKPDSSSSEMKPGSSQNDIVSGDASPSSILLAVSRVGSRSSPNGSGASPLRKRCPFLMTQNPPSSLAALRLDPLGELGAPVEKKDA